MGLHGIQGLYGLQGLVSAGGGAVTYKSKVLSYSPIAYWMMAEAAGGTSIDEIDSPNQDGAYTGVTLGQTGIGDGNTCPLFDGANDYNNIQTATFTGNFDGQEGSCIIWAKVSGAGVWIDGLSHYIFKLYVDGSNYVYIRKESTNNAMLYRRRSGGTLEDISKGSLSETGWMCIGLTWSKTANEIKAYYNGSQEGATKVGFNDWVGNIGVAIIGANTLTPAEVWDGYLAHCAVWDSVLAPADMADLAVIP